MTRDHLLPQAGHAWRVGTLILIRGAATGEHWIAPIHILLLETIINITIIVLVIVHGCSW